MVQRIFVPVDVPLQGTSRHGGRNRQAIVDARFNLRSFLVVIPRHQLQRRQLLARAVEAVELGKCLQPGLAALLSHDAVRSPRRQGVIETLIGRSNRMFLRVRHARVIEAGEIAHPIIAGGWHHPGVTSVRKRLSESVVVLKNIDGMRAQRGVRRIPVDRRIRKTDIEVRDHRLPVLSHISGR